MSSSLHFWIVFSHFFLSVGSLVLFTLNLKSTELGYLLLPSLDSMVLMLEVRDKFFLYKVNFRYTGLASGGYWSLSSLLLFEDVPGELLLFLFLEVVGRFSNFMRASIGWQVHGKCMSLQTVYWWMGFVHLPQMEK